MKVARTACSRGSGRPGGPVKARPHAHGSGDLSRHGRMTAVPRAMESPMAKKSRKKKARKKSKANHGKRPNS